MTLKELRKSKGLSQNEASFLLSIPLRTYKRLENDSSYVNTYKYKNVYTQISSFVASKKSRKIYNFVIVGAGYVGFSLAVLLAEKHHVTVVDTNEKKVSKINTRKPLFYDKEISYYLQNKTLYLKATTVNLDVYKNCDYVIISTPTNYDEESKNYDMSSVLSTIRDVRKANSKCTIVIKSTCYIGFTSSLKDNNIVFSPEFLREGKALYDNLHPSRIIIGGDQNKKEVKEFANILESFAVSPTKVLFMSSSEAEAVKLFSNSYLAMRVAYFNEMDSLLNSYGLNSYKVVNGVSLDPRIGDYYNNPSFGYGGYCLPKDTKALISQMSVISNNELLSSISKSNDSRKQFIINDIVSKLEPDPQNKVVGVFSLLSKTGTDNTRYSSVIDIVGGLEKIGTQVIIFDNEKMTLEDFKNKSDLIITNRYDSSLDDVAYKVYTRDLFKRD